MLKPSAPRAGQVGILTRRSWRFPIFMVIVGALIAACSSKSTDNDPEPGVADALELTTDVPATGQARTALSPAPVVQIVDAFGDPVLQDGINVAAAIQSGGGAVAGTATVASDANGQATFSNLRINGLVGSRTLRFTSAGLTAVSSGAVSIAAGPAAILGANSATSQSALVGQPVPTRPSVKVTDLDGNPIAGVAVTFAITVGNGSLTGGDQVTNAQGIATVTSWTVDAVAGANTMTATAAGLTGSPMIFSATGGNTISGFTIELIYLSSATPAQQTAFAAAKARWEQIITGDLADYTIPSPFNTTDCGATASSVISGTIEDLRIYVELVPIDGIGQVLGAAGPCDLRQTGSLLPYVGLMRFDVADLADLEADGELSDVILHEMGHVLGYGTLWQPIAGFWPTNYLNGACTPTPVFLGAGAVNAYATLNGGSGNVPVHGTPPCDINGDGDGTRDSHWDETTFKSELMTGFISGNVRPMSATSIRSVEDLGYVVDVSVADAFNLATQPTLRDDRNARVTHLRNDVLRLPIWITDPATGKRRAIRR